MVKAVVLGAAGGIGQPLSLLLKASPLISQLDLYDVVNTPGVAADLSHIASLAQITGYLPADGGFEKALTGADIVVVPAGIPRKPGMSRDDLFKINAGIIRDLITGVAKYCPKAFILIISNPVNSTVPIAAEILKAHKVFDATRLFGVTTLDVVRASTFTAEITGEKDSRKIVIPVIGGHSGATIVPLLSLAQPACKIPEEKLDELVHRIQFGGDEVVAAKNGGGSATLSMAFAAQGERGIVEPTFVYLPGVPGGDEISKALGGIDFFAIPVELGLSGVVRATNPIPSINAYEKTLVEIAIGDLRKNIEKGVEFARSAEPAKL